jgi:imidazolonepropionase-like amidohydrolase
MDVNERRAPTDGRAWLLRDVTLLDVRRRQVLSGQAVCVDEGLVVASGRSDDFGAEPAAHSIDLGGRYVVPGFIDPHVHLAFNGTLGAVEDVGSDESESTWQLAVRNAGELLAAGVTTAADCGGPMRFALGVMRAIESGVFPGPRMLMCLRPLTIRGGHCHHFGYVASGSAALRDATRELIEEGADFIKVMASGGATPCGYPPTTAQYSQSELTAIVEVAHARACRVVAHARAVEAIRASVSAGVDRLEHVTWEVEGGVAYDEGVAFDIARRGIWVDPTIAAGYRAARSPDVPQVRREGLASSLAQRYPNYRRMAREAGLPLLCGTDAGTPLVAFDDFALSGELLGSEVGYDGWEVLSSATLWGAEALGIARTRGAIEPGMFADLVVLSENPLATPSALRRVTDVMLGGRWCVGGPSIDQPEVGSVGMSLG